MRALLCLCLYFAACGGAELVPAPCSPSCTEAFSACMVTAPDYGGMLACRDTRDSCLGREAPPTDGCFGHLGACLQADTSTPWRRRCLTDENACLAADGGTL